VFGEILAVKASGPAHGPLLYAHGAFGGFASVATTEKTVLEVLTSRSAENTTSVPVDELLRRDTLAAVDLQQALDRGVARIYEMAGKPHLDIIDAQVVALLGDFRAIGDLEEVGFDTDALRKYVELAADLSRRE